MKVESEDVTVWITDGELDRESTEAVARTADGAVVTFVGVVRDLSEGKAVSGLEYEAYEPMATDVMRSIGRDAADRWRVGRVVMAHRVGRLSVGEVSVIVAVSAPHRGEAFDACEFCIDTLKKSVPIWKKELFADGTSSWVNHP